ncbi:unnamed protein product [Eruca vesicaria subsp. sativa]|uniref:F-box domain-containing protein n=1 Tax=Eruca vesicaria subsp. sativa TaxID=29727 RepID=A0ABC8LKX5_ERUVS|nr:unnamed protein product [Eruca vesicaria subsp. sativa]
MEDMFNRLPNPIISHILSFLPTKEAASTSVLSKRWRLLFISVTNLDFEGDEESPTFVGFVDRVLALQGNAKLNRFSLNFTDYPDPDTVTGWILNVLKRGVSEIVLSVSDYPLPPEIFVSKSLVKLKLEGGEGLSFTADVAKVLLPKVKTLEIESVEFEEGGVGFVKLLSGCPVLEELVLMNLGWEHWKSCSVLAKSLKRLKFFCEDNDENPKSVSFDTPNLVYLEYSDNIAKKYPKVKFNSLVEAHISLRLTEDQSADAVSDEEDEYFYESDDGEVKDMAGNATNFFKGICNVQILYLSAKTLEVLAFCCEATPVFNNLIQLTVESDEEFGWDSLPGLLKNCPNLETLVFKGLVHKRTKGCGEMCLCKPLKDPSYISSSTVKVLKIILSVHIDDEGSEVEEIKHFLEKMPQLDQLIVYFDISYEHSVFELSKKLQSIPRIASPKCNIQVISQNLSLSSTVPSSLTKKWSAPPKEEYTWFLKAVT